MIKLKIIKTYLYPSGLTFIEGEIYWGYYNYVFSLYRPLLGEESIGEEISNLCVIFKEDFMNGLLIPLEYIEKI